MSLQSAQEPEADQSTRDCGLTISFAARGCSTRSQRQLELTLAAFLISSSKSAQAGAEHRYACSDDSFMFSAH